MSQKIDMNDWERRSAQAWGEIDDYYARGEAGAADFRTRIGELAGELPQDSPVAAFERAFAWDSTGHPDKAAPLYQEALERGLAGMRRRQAVIQMASSLRDIGRAAESVELLIAEQENHDPDAAVLADALSAFLALCLADVGREREAVSVALAALAPHFPRYQRSLVNHARLSWSTTRPDSAGSPERASRGAAIVDTLSEHVQSGSAMAANAATDEEIPNELTWEMQREYDSRRLDAAIGQAQLGLAEGGIPVGAALVVDGEVLATGRNRRVQLGSAIRHAEMDCLENAGRLAAAVYARATMYTTLSPCSMCAGAILLYRIPRVVMGENRTFKGAEEQLASHGVEVINMDSAACADLMREFIDVHPDIWNEDIGRCQRDTRRG